MLGSAVKFGRVAEGGVDIYHQRRPAEWDVAAGHAVVTATGSKITDSKCSLHFSSGAKFHRAGVHRLGRPIGQRLDLLRQHLSPGGRWRLS